MHKQKNNKLKQLSLALALPTKNNMMTLSCLELQEDPKMNV